MEEEFYHVDRRTDITKLTAVRRYFPKTPKTALQPPPPRPKNCLKTPVYNSWSSEQDGKRGADKSLTRPGRKQATATEDFDFHISYL